MRGPRACWILAALAGCSSVPTLDQWGQECRDAYEPAVRMSRVRALVGSGQERAIPILIDCLEDYKRKGKKPDRNYQATAWDPNVTVPAELWGLWMLTSRDFDFDVPKWRAWYANHEGRLDWDGGYKRFVPK